MHPHGCYGLGGVLNVFQCSSFLLLLFNTTIVQVCQLQHTSSRKILSQCRTPWRPTLPHRPSHKQHRRHRPYVSTYIHLKLSIAVHDLYQTNPTNCVIYRVSGIAYRTFKSCQYPQSMHPSGRSVHLTSSSGRKPKLFDINVHTLH